MKKHDTQPGRTYAAPIKEHKPGEKSFTAAGKRYTWGKRKEIVDHHGTRHVKATE